MRSDALAPFRPRHLAFVAIGAWLIVSPWIFEFSSDTTAMLNAMGSGVMVQLIPLYCPSPWKPLAGSVAAIWLILSAWILSYDHLKGAVICQVLSGLVVLSLAGWDWTDRHMA